jgi:hypothetical protein
LKPLVTTPQQRMAPPGGPFQYLVVSLGGRVVRSVRSMRTCLISMCNVAYSGATNTDSPLSPRYNHPPPLILMPPGGLGWDHHRVFMPVISQPSQFTLPQHARHRLRGIRRTMASVASSAKRQATGPHRSIALPVSLMVVVAVGGVSHDINPDPGRLARGGSHHYTPLMPESICETTESPRMVQFFIVGHTERDFVGHAVSEAILMVGPATTKLDLGNGRMAFDWLHYRPCTYSAIATTRKPGSPSLADWTIESWRKTADCSTAR